MAEKDMRATVVGLLREWHAFSVENPVHPGTPDVNCTLGWIELKWIRSWPKNPDDKVLIPHFSPQQRIWLLKRWNAGGSAWLLLNCKREWLIFNGRTAFEFVGKTTYQGLVEVCHQHWTRKPEPIELYQAIVHRNI